MQPKHAPFLIVSGILATVAHAWANPPGCGGLSQTASPHLTQNFEAFTIGSGCSQGGWTGLCPTVSTGFLMQPAPGPLFGTLSATFQTTGAPAVLGAAFVSPILGPQSGRLTFDILITLGAPTNTPGFTVETYACGGCVINTRLFFNPNGSIDVLQPPCTAAVFTPSSGTWTPGIAMRIGIEVDGVGNLWVLKDNVQVFTGNDIALFCSTSRGIAGLTVGVDDNTAVGDTLALDNLGCPGNVVTTGPSGAKCDIDDLLGVITQWGPCQAPPAACPANSTNAGTSVNTVDVDDLQMVICCWGTCY